jgi:hypothetical protein
MRPGRVAAGRVACAVIERPYISSIELSKFGLWIDWRSAVRVPGATRISSPDTANGRAIVIHATRRHAATLILALTVGMVTTAPAALAGTSLSASASLAPRSGELRSVPAVLVTTRTVTPRVQRTVRLTGYATYTFTAPTGRRIFSASARIVGADPHAVEIRRRTVAQNRTRYTVNLVFPGEQGNPGKLVVRLATIA